MLNGEQDWRGRYLDTESEKLEMGRGRQKQVASVCIVSEYSCDRSLRGIEHPCWTKVGSRSNVPGMEMETRSQGCNEWDLRYCFRLEEAGQKLHFQEMGRIICGHCEELCISDNHSSDGKCPDKMLCFYLLLYQSGICDLKVCSVFQSVPQHNSWW